MKTLILTLFLCICSLLVSAQVNDSTKNQLEEYKDLYEKGLIDSAEYSNLKKQMLFGTPLKEEAPKDVIVIKDYRPQQTVGRIITTVGLLGLLGSAVYWFAGKPELTGPQSQQDLDQYEEDLETYEQNRVLYLGFSSVDTFVGILILDSANRKRDKAKKASLSMHLNINEIGLALHF